MSRRIIPIAGILFAFFLLSISLGVIVHLVLSSDPDMNDDSSELGLPQTDIPPAVIREPRELISFDELVYPSDYSVSISSDGSSSSGGSRTICTVNVTEGELSWVMRDYLRSGPLDVRYEAIWSRDMPLSCNCTQIDHIRDNITECDRCEIEICSDLSQLDMRSLAGFGLENLSIPRTGCINQTNNGIFSELCTFEGTPFLLTTTQTNHTSRWIIEGIKDDFCNSVYSHEYPYPGCQN